MTGRSAAAAQVSAVRTAMRALRSATHVRRVGTLAHAALMRSGGITHAVPGFEATSFRLAGNEVIWVSSEGPDHPRTALIEAGAACEVLAVSSGTEISFCDAVETLGGCAFPIDDARKAASIAILRLMHISTPRGCASLMQGQSPPFPFSHRADSAHALACACATEDDEAFVHHAQRLLGAGSGLTPSGDDFVGGALFALRLNQAERALPVTAGSVSVRAKQGAARAARWQRAATQIVTRAASRTHIISAVLLSDLARGQSYAALHAFAAAIAHGDADAAFNHATALTSIGASSGWDMLAGFMAALRGSADTLTLPHSFDTPHATTHGIHRHA